MNARLLPPLLAVACLGAGCARSGDFPSLAPRPVEQLSFDEPVREAPALPSDPALIARIEALVAQARSGQADFDALSGEAQRAVARAGAAGSEGWVVAQQALSRLQAARRETVTALADLDALSLDRANRPTSAEDARAIASAVEAVAGLSQAQQQRIDALKARLSPA